MISEQNKAGYISRQKLWLVVLILLLIFGGVGFAFKRANDTRLAQIERDQRVEQMQSDQEIQSLRDELGKVTVADGEESEGDVSVNNGTSSGSVTGIQGPAGQQGVPGVAGATGATGPQGVDGATGSEGQQGPQGPQGPSGVASCPNGNCLSLQTNSSTTQETGSIDISGNGEFGGDVSADSFRGSGVGLTNVDAATLNGQNSSFYQNADNINAGTLADARLSSNVALQDAANAFALQQNFAGGFLATTGTLSGNLTVNGATALQGLTTTGILQNGYQVCDASNNCSYAAGSGSANYIQNGTALQTANFNISGNGTIGGTVKIGTHGYITPSGSDITISSGRNLTLQADTATSGSIVIASDLSLGSSHASWRLGNRNLTITNTSIGGTQGSGKLVVDTGANPFTINSSVTYFNGGSVGIGTVSPASKLHMYVSSGSNYLTVENATNGQAALNLKNNTASWIQYVDTAGRLRFYNSSNLLAITATGQVGLGIDGPSERLHVSGNGLFTGSITGVSLFQGANQVCDTSNNCSYAAATGGTGYIQNQTASAQTGGFNVSGNGTVGGALVVQGGISSSGSGMQSERFGYGATSAGISSLSVGRNASVSGDYSVAVGASANAAGSYSFASGVLANAAANGSIAIGKSATATSSHLGSIVIGTDATSTAAGQLVIGGPNYNVTQGYFGRGVTHALPTSFTINATGGSGTDIAGANLLFAGGRGTGTGVGGDIVLQTAAAGGSTGAGLNTLVERLRVTSAGNVGIGTSNPAAKLEIQGNSTGTASTLSISTISSQNSGTVHNAYSNIYGNSTSGSANFVGYRSRVLNSSNATVYNAQSFVALDGEILHQSNGGTLTNAIGANVNVNNNSTGTITNSYGLKVVNAGSGPVTNAYGVHIGDLLGSASFGIYQAGANDNNYFAGNVGVGSVNPDAKVVVKGSGSSNSTYALKVLNSSDQTLLSVRNDKLLEVTDDTIFQFSRSVSTPANSPRLRWTGNNVGQIDVYGEQLNLIVTGGVQTTHVNGFIGTKITLNRGSASNPVITASNGNTGGIFFTNPGSGQSGIGIATEGTEKMRVNVNGNVGIGTTSDLGQLAIVNDVSGEIGLVVKGASGQTANLFELQGSSGSTPLSVFDSSGSLGVGTASLAGYKLNVNGNTSLGGYTYVSGNIEAAANAYIAGNMGVGTLSPSVKMHIVAGGTLQPSYGSSTAMALARTNSASTDVAFALISGNTGMATIKLGDTDNEQRGRITYNNATDALSLYSNNQERLLIDSSGLVGIGAAASGAQLQVTSTNTSRAGLVIQGASGQTADLAQFKNSGGTNLFKIRSDGNIQAENNLEIYAAGRATPHVIFGQFGIPVTTFNSLTNFASPDATVVPLSVSGTSTQTADLFQARNSSGTALAKIDAAGNLTVKNATVEGTYITFSNNIRGYNVLVAALATSQTVTFTTAHPDANYAVFCTPNWNTTCFVTNKTTTGFTLNYGAAAPSGQLVDWFVAR